MTILFDLSQWTWKRSTCFRSIENPDITRRKQQWFLRFCYGSLVFLSLVHKICMSLFWINDASSAICPCMSKFSFRLHHLWQIYLSRSHIYSWIFFERLDLFSLSLLQIYMCAYLFLGLCLYEILVWDLYKSESSVMRVCIKIFFISYTAFYIYLFATFQFHEHRFEFFFYDTLCSLYLIFLVIRKVFF